MKRTMAIGILALAGSALAQWEVSERTDDFTGEVSRTAVSSLTDAEGGAWYTNYGLLSIGCFGREGKVVLVFDSIVFSNNALYGSGSAFQTNVDGEIKEWSGSPHQASSGDSLLLAGSEAGEFLDMLTKASNLKVQVWAHQEGPVLLDINMEGAEQAIRQVCPNYAPQETQGN